MAAAEKPQERKPASEIKIQGCVVLKLVDPNRAALVRRKGNRSVTDESERVVLQA